MVVARENIDEAVRKFGVQVRKTPDYLDEFQIDEVELQNAILEFKPGISETAVRHDINSIRSIFVLRKGRQPVRLEDSGSVFVTLNQRLARAAYHVGKDHNSAREVSPAITAYSLANIAWLKSPVEAPLLPLAETMALSYAALEPSTDFFKKYVVEMDRLLSSGQISSREHEILRLSPSAREELMELTLGDEHALTASSIKSILANAKAVIVAEQQSMHAEELHAHSSESATQLSQFQEREAVALGRAESAESQFLLLQRQLEDLSGRDKQQRELRRARYERVGKWIARACVALPMLLLFFGALVGASLLAPDSGATSIARLSYPAFAFVAVVWGAYSWYSGATVSGVEKRLKEAVVNWLARTLDADEA